VFSFGGSRGVPMRVYVVGRGNRRETRVEVAVGAGISGRRQRRTCVFVYVCVCVCWCVCVCVCVCRGCCTKPLQRWFGLVQRVMFNYLWQTSRDEFPVQI